MRLSRSTLALAILCAVGTLAFAVTAADAAPLYAKAAGDHSAWIYGAQFALAVGLDNMRTQHADLVRMAAAKLGEVKDGLAKDAIAKIEQDHRDLLANAETVARAIADEEKKPVGKPWAAGFFASAGTSGLDLAALNEIVTASATHDQAKDALINKMSAVHNANKPSPNGVRATITMEGRDKLVKGITASIMAKTPLLAGDKEAERNEFSGYRLEALARMMLESSGVRVTTHDPMQMIAQAMQPVVMQGALSTSDFVNILANIANKSMLKGYEEADESFPLWTVAGTLPDFKTAKRVDLGLYPSLPEVIEGAPVTYSKLTDRGVDLTIASYGSIFPITRESIVNDDLGMFTKIPSRMGQASKRTIGNLVYAVLTANAAMADSVALFHATHKNLQTSAALATATLSAGRALMAKQKDADSVSAALNIKPAYLIVPVALEALAKQLVNSAADPSQANPGVANPNSGIAKVVSDARLDVNSATTWYLAGSPAQYDTIEVDYLNGVQAPTLEQRDGWNINGVEFKIRMDVGVNLLDFRALQKSTSGA